MKKDNRISFTVVPLHKRKLEELRAAYKMAEHLEGWLKQKVQGSWTDAPHMLEISSVPIWSSFTYVRDNEQEASMPRDL